LTPENISGALFWAHLPTTAASVSLYLTSILQHD